MIIIVEGIDRVGKSTLCNKLSETLNIPIFKYSGLISNDKKRNDYETDKLLLTLEAFNCSKQSVIFDRFHLTDYVYGRLERNYKHKKANFNFEIIEHELNKIGNVHLIYVIPTDIHYSSCEHRKNLLIHNELFNNVFENSIIENKYKIDYNGIDNLVNGFAIMKKS